MANFRKATKFGIKARIALSGPSGSGKSFTALQMAQGLGPRIAAVDTEHGSMSRYANLFDFDVDEPDSYDPAKLIVTIHEAEKAGYDVLIVDSLSHYWMGKDGELEQVDNIKKRSNTQNGFTAWKDVTPLHNQLIDTMLGSKLHLIVTLRTKTEWVLEPDERGKMAPRKIGTTPIMRLGLEYEFDIGGELNQEHELIISKTRCPELSGGIFKKAGADVAAIIAAWCQGEPAPELPKQAPVQPPPLKADDPLTQRSQRIVDTFKARGFTESAFKGYLQARFRASSTKTLTTTEAEVLLAELACGFVQQWVEVGSPPLNGKDNVNVYLASRFDLPDVSTKHLTSDEFATVLSEIEDGTVAQFLATPSTAEEASA